MKRLQLIAVLVVSFALVVFIHSAFAASRIYFGIVTASALNVRENPSKRSRLVGQVPKGQEIMIWSKKGDWYYMAYGDIDGWVSSKYVVITRYVN